MMMEFKARAETGVQLSSTLDFLWMIGVILSYIGIIIMILMGRGIQSILLSVIYGTIWLWPLLIFDPQPIYSMILLFAVIGTITWFYLKKKG